MNSHIKSAIEAGSHPLGTWISIGHPAVVEAVAQLDLDFVLVDMEHTTMSLETVENLVRAVDSVPGETDVVVRAPWNDPVRLKRLVDIGMAGVMVPMVETADEARRFAESVRYPPEGIRGLAGSRATGYGRNFEEYVNSANGSILTIAQIETEAGLEAAEEVADVTGIDALFVGPADLSRALGVFGDLESETYQRAVEHVIDVGETADVPVGTFTSNVDDIDYSVEQGFDFLIGGKDASYLMNGTERVVAEYGAAVEEHTGNPEQTSRR